MLTTMSLSTSSTLCREHYCFALHLRPYHAWRFFNQAHHALDVAGCTGPSPRAIRESIEQAIKRWYVNPTFSRQRADSREDIRCVIEWMVGFANCRQPRLCDGKSDARKGRITKFAQEQGDTIDPPADLASLAS